MAINFTELFLYKYRVLGVIMQNFIYKLLKVVLDIQTKFYNKKIQTIPGSYKNGLSKIAFHGDNELVLNVETEKAKTELDKKVKEIIKDKLDNPEKLLSFIKEQGTDVFRINNADILLSIIGEEEGFITPLNGLKAFWTNLFVNFAVYKKIVISFKSNEMFILRPLPVDIYYMIHQFHKWYSFKLELPGFNYKEQENFKKIFKTLKQEDITTLTLGEIISLKEAIARDVEAIDFVVNLSKEYDTSKKLLKRLKTGNAVNI